MRPRVVSTPPGGRRRPGVVELGRLRADRDEQLRRADDLHECCRLLGPAEGDLHGPAALVLRLLGRARRLFRRCPGARADRYRVDLRRAPAARLCGLVRDRARAVDPDCVEARARRSRDCRSARPGHAGDAPADEHDTAGPRDPSRDSAGARSDLGGVDRRGTLVLLVLGGCRTLPLANFGSVSFARAAATGDAQAGTISDPAWQATPVELAELGQDGLDPSFAGMRPSPATSGASPGPLSADGRGFAVAWHPASG